MNHVYANTLYKTANETVQKTRQVVLLYDAIIRFLQQSKLAIEEGRFEDRLNLLQKASNIIMGLHSALDFDNGGEVSQTLSNFYNAMDLRILNINRTNSVEDLEKIIKEVKIMRDGWNEVDQKASAEKSETPPTEASGEPSDFSA
jgi:flagellar protein FliS